MYHFLDLHICFLRVVLMHRVGDICVQVVFRHVLFDALESRDDRWILGEDIDAIPVILDTSLESLHMSSNADKTGIDSLLDYIVHILNIPLEGMGGQMSAKYNGECRLPILNMIHIPS